MSPSFPDLAHKEPEPISTWSLTSQYIPKTSREVLLNNCRLTFYGIKWPVFNPYRNLALASLGSHFSSHFQQQRLCPQGQPCLLHLQLLPHPPHFSSFLELCRAASCVRLPPPSHEHLGPWAPPGDDCEAKACNMYHLSATYSLCHSSPLNVF